MPFFGFKGCGGGWEDLCRAVLKTVRVINGDVMVGVLGLNYSTSQITKGVYHNTYGVGWGIKSLELVPSPITGTMGRYGSNIIGRVVPTGIPTMPFMFLKF